ncbi:flagellinolysin [Psychrosphaera aquimarina]|uniref:Flagellin n=1 Tax=Psychrosphaera aquimarina TaxID=2044854 RepID=A0ABU3QZD8_9GAMM|nr:flagellinolysin [Psychrosphaera aquimarina]MDU0112796.1 flagellinolysin [Psychrosphaera aquimarina]
MIINTNVSSLQITGLFRKNNRALTNTYNQLSSGSRINSAADDAAGLQISTRLTSQINGMKVASRNANDSISMMQVAEGAMQQVTNNLQRMRDIALQAANATNTVVDKKSLNEEYLQLSEEIDRINEATTFGGQRLYESNRSSIPDQFEREMVRGLQSTWLGESEKIIEQYFGITGQGELKLDLERDADDGTLAWVTNATVGGVKRVTLTIDLAEFKDIDSIHNGLDNYGGTKLDEIVLHEMVHATMVSTMDEFNNLPAWFKEGAAEVLRGGDDQIAGNSGAAVLAAFNAQGTGTTVTNNLGAYGGGFVAMRYMEHTLGDRGLKNVMQELASGATFDNALNTASNGNWSNEADFRAELTGAANDTGTYASRMEEFMAEEMDSTNKDNGALGGEDANNGFTRENVMTGYGSGDRSGTRGFTETIILNDNDSDQTDFAVNSNWVDTNRGDIALQDYELDVTSAGGPLHTFQIGADANQTMQVNFGAFSTTTLGLDNVDIVNRSQFAIFAIDDALKIVDKHRAILGATQNRLESTVNNLNNVMENQISARSRILDTDYATKSAELARYQIMQQASISLMSQANQSQELALTLLG